MSRQSKAVSTQQLVKTFTKLHLEGQKGPAQTTPKHGKASANRAYSSTRRPTKKEK